MEKRRILDNILDQPNRLLGERGDKQVESSLLTHYVVQAETALSQHRPAGRLIQRESRQPDILEMCLHSILKGDEVLFHDVIDHRCVRCFEKL